MVQHQMSALVEGDAVTTIMRIHCSSRWSSLLRDEIAPAHEVVGRGAETKQPIDEASATVSQLAEERDGLQPAKRLHNEFALAMTPAVSGVSRGAGIDCAATVAELVLGDMWRDPHPSDSGHPGA